MNICLYFKRTGRSLTLRTLGSTRTSDNVVVEQSSCESARSIPNRTGRMKRKYSITFTAESRDSIGKYAGEHKNAAACKKFKESTVRSFKKKYSEQYFHVLLKMHDAIRYELCQTQKLEHTIKTQSYSIS